MKSIFMKKVSRKDFLILTGMVLLSLTGIKATLELFDDTPHKKTKDSSFGSGAYGV